MHEKAKFINELFSKRVEPRVLEVSQFIYNSYKLKPHDFNVVANTLLKGAIVNKRGFISYYEENADDVIKNVIEGKNPVDALNVFRPTNEDLNFLYDANVIPDIDLIKVTEDSIKYNLTPLDFGYMIRLHLFSNQNPYATEKIIEEEKYISELCSKYYSYQIEKLGCDFPIVKNDFVK